MGRICLHNHSVKTIWCWSTLTHLIFCINFFLMLEHFWLNLFFASYLFVMLEHFDSSYVLHLIFCDVGVLSLILFFTSLSFRITRLLVIQYYRFYLLSLILLLVPATSFLEHSPRHSWTFFNWLISWSSNEDLIC